MKYLVFAISICLALASCGGGDESHANPYDAAAQADAAAQEIADTASQAAETPADYYGDTDKAKEPEVEAATSSEPESDFEAVLQQAYLSNDPKQVLSRIYDAEKGTYCYMYNSTALGCK